MTIQTVGTVAGALRLDDSIRVQYVSAYEDQFWYSRVYDQIAAPVGMPMEELQKGSSVQVNFLSKMNIATTAISEVSDVVPEALRDATASITPTSRAGALQVSEALLIQAYTDYGEHMFKLVGEAAAESIDVLARDAATQGTLVQRDAARASLDAGSTSNRLNELSFMRASTRLQTLKAPYFVGDDPSKMKRWAAIFHPDAFHDLRRETSSNVAAVGQYQQAGIHLNWELGELGPFRLIVNPLAKVFGGAGADAAAASLVDTTINTAAQKLATTIAVAAGTNMATVAATPRYLTIGTEETGATHLPDNERVWVTGFTGSTVTFVGEGPNGGLRFDHAAAAAVRSADSVYTVVLGGPASLAKVFATSVGEFGQVVGPKKDGIVDQFLTLGYKFYGAYAIMAQNRILRIEVSSSADA